MTDRDPFQELLDESRHREELEVRARERWLAAQLHEGADLAGTLADLAEQGIGVVLRTVMGAAHHGWIEGVAIDHVVLRTPDGTTRYLALGAVTEVRPEPWVRPGPAAGDREPSLDLTVAEVLARAVHERPRVGLRVLGQGAVVTGQLVAVGLDVASLRLDGGAGVAYVNVGTITELRFE